MQKIYDLGTTSMNHLENRSSFSSSPLLKIVEGQFSQLTTERVKEICFYSQKIELLTENGNKVIAHFPYFSSDRELKAYLKNVSLTVIQMKESAQYQLKAYGKGLGGGNNPQGPSGKKTSDLEPNPITDRYNYCKKKYDELAESLRQGKLDQEAILERLKKKISSLPREKKDLKDAEDEYQNIPNVYFDTTGRTFQYSVIGRSVTNYKISLNWYKKEISLLIQYANNLNTSGICTPYGYEDPLIFTLISELELFAAILAKGANPNSVRVTSNKSAETLFQATCLEKQKQSVEALINAGCNIAQEGVFFPLISNWLDIVDSMLQKGVNVNTGAPLARICAGNKDWWKLAEELIKRGANVNLASNDTMVTGSPLFLAIKKCEEHPAWSNIVSLLLQQGAKPNSTENLFADLLLKMNTSQSLEVHIIYDLFQANINPKDDEHFSFFDAVVFKHTRANNLAGNKWFEMLKILPEKGFKPRTGRYLPQALIQNDEELYHLLLKAGANVNAPDLDGTTALEELFTRCISNGKFNEEEFNRVQKVFHTILALKPDPKTISASTFAKLPQHLQKLLQGQMLSDQAQKDLAESFSKGVIGDCNADFINQLYEINKIQEFQQMIEEVIIASGIPAILYDSQNPVVVLMAQELNECMVQQINKVLALKLFFNPMSQFLDIKECKSRLMNAIALWKAKKEVKEGNSIEKSLNAQKQIDLQNANLNAQRALKATMQEQTEQIKEKTDSLQQELEETRKEAQRQMELQKKQEDETASKIRNLEQQVQYAQALASSAASSVKRY